MTIYDGIGTGYAERRREDPKIAAAITTALGDSASVVNVGAGAGSYEPRDREVIAVEPSTVMIAQRDPRRATAVVGRAEDLPLADASIDAAMTLLSLHHWESVDAGLREMQRVARRRIVILTIDPAVSGQTWLMADCLTEVAERDNATMPSPAAIAQTINGRVDVVPVPADCQDGFLLAFWAHPEWVLDPGARAATSGFALMPDTVVDRVTSAVAADLASGEWDRRYGHLRTLESYDAGLRLITADV